MTPNLSFTNTTPHPTDDEEYDCLLNDNTTTAGGGNGENSTDATTEGGSIGNARRARDMYISNTHHERNSTSIISSLLIELDRRRRRGQHHNDNNNNKTAIIQRIDQQQQQQQHTSHSSSSVNSSSSSNNRNTSSKWTVLLFGQGVAVIATSMNAASYEIEHGLHKIFPMFLMFFSYVILTTYLYLSHRSLLVQQQQQQQTADTRKSNRRATHNNNNNNVYDDDDDIHYYQYHLPLNCCWTTEKKPSTTTSTANKDKTRCLQLRMPWYCYIVLSILDVGPNYLALIAYANTSFVSATLLQSLTVPSTMIFCTLLLQKQYTVWHWIGVALCMLGGLYTVLMDTSNHILNNSIDIAITQHQEYQQQQQHSYYGDIIAVLAAIGYGMGDATAEFWSKYVDRREYLGMIGLFGSIGTFWIAIIFERETIMDLVFCNESSSSSCTAIVPAQQLLCAMGWYVLSLTLYYVVESSFLYRSDATLLNLSLQCQNIWAVVCSVLIFGEIPDTNFYISMVVILSGVCIYEFYGNTPTSTIAKNSTTTATATANTSSNNSSSSIQRSDDENNQRGTQQQQHSMSYARNDTGSNINNTSSYQSMI